MNNKLKPQYIERIALTTLFILLNLISEPLTAQNISPLAQRIVQAESKKAKFQSIEAFKNIEFNQEIALKSDQKVKDLVKLNLIPEIAQFVVETKPEFISLSIPLTNGLMSELLLEKQQLYDHEARLTTQSDSKGVALQEGAFYHGIIKGDLTSMVAISFFNNEVMGVISNNELGNLVIGKINGATAENSNEHVIYKESALPTKNPFHCGVEEDYNRTRDSKNELESELTIYPNKCKVVKVFLECDFRLYQDRGSSKNAVEAFITGIFNVVKALYANEKVNIEISEIMVWTSQDPYLKTTLANIIYDYANRRGNNFNGTLAQLVTTFPIQQQGGIAFVDGMCKKWDGQTGPLSFAFIYNQSSSPLPAYSWNVEVMAHEMGHNFGSWHTHSCVWGPNKNSQIDNCQPADIGACNDGIAPIGGGTVMSYCHLTSYGINFSKGFGTEPGDILRNSFSTKACIPSSISPLIATSIKGPYFEGDSVKLTAKPYNKNYQYDWFHYDYIKNKNSDTSLTIKQAGIYTLAISNTNCTEYSTPDTIKFNDFLVNLGCPVIPGKRDSFVGEITLQVDNTNYVVDSLNFPTGLYTQIPREAIDVLVELQMTITPKGSSFVRSVVSKYESPKSIAIKNDNYAPNDQIPFSQKSATSFSRILGNFDPAGFWIFSGIDIRTDAGIDASVVYKIVLSWRSRDSVLNCDIPICDNSSKNLDAGIPNASYNWTNGANSKSISYNQIGSIGVTATKANKSSSHFVNLVLTNTKFSQNLSICEGSSIGIGKKVYNLAGTYIDTLQAITKCDSILTTILEIKPKTRTSSDQFVCYNEKLNNIVFLKDSLISSTFLGMNGCDSIHTIHYIVNPELKLALSYDKKCNDEGTAIFSNAGGGTGNLTYAWNTGLTDSLFTGAKSGIYTVTITDEKNCSISKTIEVINFDSVSVQSEIKNVLCFGDQNGEIKLNVLKGEAPFNYNWSNGNHDSIISNLMLGKYTVIIFDANGCRFDADYNVQAPDLLFVNADVKPSFGNNGSVELMIFGGTTPYHYKWSNSDTSMNISSLVPGTYTVEITDANGCSNIQSYEVQNRVSVVDYSKESKIELAPNPFKNILTIHTKEIGINSIELRNLQAQLVFARQYHNENSFKLSLTDIPAGNYMLSIGLKDRKIIHRLIVKAE
ncbi:MAG: M12 family metallo-peptidase [Saprospiraceae bacterium]